MTLAYRGRFRQALRALGRESEFPPVVAELRARFPRRRNLLARLAAAGW